VRSLAAIAFIAAAAAAGILVALRPTVMDGRVIAGNMMEQVAKKGVNAVDCDREIPIGKAGAVFQCTLSGTDGSSARFEYTMDRAGQLSAKLLDASGPARPPRNTGPDGDPWD
jgi:hypothetical protein